MLVNMEQLILNIDGQHIELPEDRAKPLTLGLAAVIALQNNYPDEQTLTGDEKISRFTLALKIHNVKEVDLKLDEVNKIKTLVNKQFGTLVYARVHQLLEEAASASAAGMRKVDA